MPDIYEQHRAAFAQVAAYTIAHKGKRVATIAFKFPRDGAGRLYAYVHWIGLEMTRGHVSGGGYDKRSAACANAARKLIANVASLPATDRNLGLALSAFCEALALAGCGTWDSALRDAGFDVWGAV